MQQQVGNCVTGARRVGRRLCFEIIFAISVHELECWLLSICKDLKAEKITGCFESLQRECKDIKVEKNYTTYDKLSRVFLKNKELLKISSKNSSFDIFIKSLQLYEEENDINEKQQEEDFIKSNSNNVVNIESMSCLPK